MVGNADDKMIRTPLDLKPKLLNTLKLLAKGYSNIQIGEETKTCDATVCRRITKLKEVTGGMNRVELAVWYTKFEMTQGQRYLSTL